MRKSKTTKRALFSSVVSLIICFAMLIGTTFAWFTDSVTSGVNQIVAGNLDIDVTYYDVTTSTWKPLQDASTLFSSSLWEPGHTEFVTLKIENKGTLDLNYKVLVTPVSENGGVSVKDGSSFKLSNYLVFGTVPSDTEPTYDRDSARAAVGTTTGLADVNTLTKTGTMVGKTATATDVQYVTLVVYMPETVGNEANYKTGTAAPTIDLGIKVLATQKTAENDSFGPDYDAGAVTDSFYTVGAYYDYYPQVMASKTVTVAAGNTVATATTIEATGKLNSTDTTDTTLAKVSVPVGAKLKDDTSELTVKVVPKEPAASTTTGTALVAEINNPNRETANFDIKVEGIASTNTEDIEVEVFVGKGLANVKVYHNGAEITIEGYDADTGIVKFKTKGFSDFTAAYDVASAAIGAQTYGSLENAVAAAKAGDTVVLLKDVTLSNRAKIDKAITLDLNGKTVKNDTGAVLWAVNADVSIVGTGTISSMNPTSGASVVWLGSGTDAATLTIGKDVTVSGSAQYGISIFGINGASANLTVNGKVTTTGDGAAISGNGTYNPASITINEGATVSCTNGAGIYFPQAGTLTINGGSITGAHGVQMCSGTLNITGSPSITATGTDNTSTKTGDGPIQDGAAVSVVNRGYPGGAPTANISGTPTLTGEQALRVYTWSNNTVTDWTEGKNAVAVTGGTFSSDPSAYLAADYNVVADGDRYKVIEGTLVANAEEMTAALNSGAKIILLNSAEGLEAFANEVNVKGNGFSSKTIKLDADIDLAGKDWTPIGSSGSVESYPNKTFAGTFDGQNYTISNFKVAVNGEWAAAGLFGTANRATIKNVVIDGANLHSTHYAGGILGYETECTVISNCHVKNSTIVSAAESSTGEWDNGDKVGGIVGYMNKANLSDCTVSNTSIQGYRDLGGIAGYIGGGTVSDCSITNVTITVDNTHDYKNYNGTGYDANSIIGENYGTMTNCTGTATINNP